MSLRETLGEALDLKALDRAGWVRCGLSAPESVAAHSWGVAWLALALCPEHLDRQRCLGMALLHDLAEVRVGDITPRDGVPAHHKASAEKQAFHDLLAERPDLLGLATEYEARDTPEARFVRQLDRLDMALQARRYHDQGRLSDADLAEFLSSALSVIEDPALRALAGP